MPVANDDDYLPMSAMQHFVFCERQCALIHLDREWKENVLTAEGRVVHERVDLDPSQHRSDTHALRGIWLRSDRLRLVGIADVVEQTGRGASLAIRPVEYKRSKLKKRAQYHEANATQLCAQAMAIEEMFGLPVSEGAIFYAGSRRRHVIVFDETRRIETERLAERMHEMFAQRKLPAAVNDWRCPNCSMIEICRPSLVADAPRLHAYVKRLYEVP